MKSTTLHEILGYVANHIAVMESHPVESRPMVWHTKLAYALRYSEPDVVLQRLWEDALDMDAGQKKLDAMYRLHEYLWRMIGRNNGY